MNRPVEPWILTASGRAFDLLSPTVESVDPGDIAQSLSRQCRWTGHTRAFYSVAEHSVRVAELVSSFVHMAYPSAQPDEHRQCVLAALLHDAHEAYLGDLASPLKRAIGASIVDQLERRVDAAIASRFSLNVDLFRSDAVKRADLTLLVTEARDLMPSAPREWMPEGVRPLPTRIEPWTATEARERFRVALGALRP